MRRHRGAGHRHARGRNFPAPGEKVSASEFIITGGGCAANAAVAIARLGGRVAFAGPLGGGNDQVSNRIVSDLAAEGVDLRRRPARRRGDRIGVAHLARCRGREDHRHPPRRQSRQGAAGRRRQAGGGCRCGVDRQPFSGISSRRCAAPRMRARFPSSSISIRRASRTTRCLSSAPMWCHRRKPCTAPLGLPIMAPACSAWPNISPAFSPSPTGRMASIGATMALCATCRPSRCRRSIRSAPATPSTAASRSPSQKGAHSATPCASPAPPPRSNARISAAARARPRRAEVEEFLKKDN